MLFSFFQVVILLFKKCECILKSCYDNCIMVQYVYIDLYEFGNFMCIDSFVLFESKLNFNQIEFEKRMEVCGR